MTDIKQFSFEEIIENLRKEIGNYTYDIVEDSKFLYENKIRLEQMETKILDRSRWSVLTQVIYKYKNRYLTVVWNDPATECQDGQETDCQVFEVEQIQKIEHYYQRKIIIKENEEFV